MELQDLKNTDIREIGKDMFRVINESIGLDETLNIKEMHEALDSTIELARDLSYAIKNK